MKSIHVICAVDSHIPYLKSSLDNLKKKYPDDEYAIASYHHANNPNKLLSKFCESNMICYYDAPQNFNISILPYCEIVGIMEVSDYFYSLGYDEVYLLHNDVIIFDEYKETFRNLMHENWSLICPFMNFLTKEKQLNSLWHTHNQYSSSFIEKYTTLRLTLSLLIFNKNFLSIVKTKYGSFENFYQLEMKNSSPYGDCGLFDIDCFNFKINPILNSDFLLEGCWFSSEENIINYLDTHNDYKYIHLGAGFNKNLDLYNYEK
jgi:hypothetical protein